MSESERPDKKVNPGIPASQSASDYAVTQGLDRTPEHRSIGNYQLLKKLGEGGMGQVWLAEQTTPVRRQVALKLIRAGMCDETMLQRFQSERQSLAIMDHPSIAKVFEAGATADGQPYFVMEYVPGLPITDYCDQKRLGIRKRLELFMQVCEGVQHAHQKSIVHRDIKPANILVVEVDGRPTARIIDFGLAKAIIPRGFGGAAVTLEGTPLGTPAYMSPEQASPDVADVDTRTDVYSLGVVLYELLTGTLPFDPKQWENKPLDFVLRQLREGNPPRPSTQFNKKASTQREAATAAADVRNTDPTRLVTLLRGDLDWITMKALEKNRARRYGTPSEFSADISRYLNDEPVLAGPETAGYRIQKYVVRHRLALGIAVILLVMVTGFVVTQAVELRRISQERDRATRERDRAAKERDRATHITDFLSKMFKVSNPSEARGNSITAREILDKASADVGASLTKDPELQAQMMHVMGDVYDNLGLYARAESLQKESMQIRQRVLGPEHSDTLESANSLAITLSHEGRYADAEKLFRETLDIRRRVLVPEDPDTLKSMNNFAYVLEREGHYAEAEKLFRETIDTRRRVLGPEHPYTLASMGNLAGVLDGEGRYAEAEKLDRETLEIQRRVLGPEDPSTLLSMNSLANVLDDESRYAEAEKLYRETLDIRRRVLGDEHMDTLQSMNNLGSVLDHEGHSSEAEKLYRETLEIQRRVLSPDHPDTANSMYNVACMAARRGQRDEAIALLREAVDHGLRPSIELGIEKDPDFKLLHGDPRFVALVAHAKERAGAGQRQS